MVIFRADRQHDAETFKLLYVGLKLVVGLRNAGLLADLDAVYAVVAHNAAPQGVIEVKSSAFLFLPKIDLIMCETLNAKDGIASKHMAYLYMFQNSGFDHSFRP